MTSKASMSTACVSMGAWYQYQPVFCFQYMPSSSFCMARSRSEAMISAGTRLSPKRSSARAIMPCGMSSRRTQYRRAWSRQNSKALRDAGGISREAK
jgi:hypothetical protein